MVLTISQESYDETLRQNIEDFGMTVEEAIKETIEQFRAQGVDLSHIVTDWMSAGNAENEAILKEAINTLKCLVERLGQHYDAAKCIQQLEVIKDNCEKSLSFQVFAGKQGAYHVILDTLLKCESDIEVVKCCLKTLISLMTKQPDLLDDQGVLLILKNIDAQRDPEIINLTLRWTKECCIMHERNRQNIFNAEILEHLKPLLQHASAVTLRDVLGVLRALVLDDDVRVDFGKAHEHARVIASDTLCTIMGLLEKYKRDEPLVNDLLLTLCALLVRTEFCKKVEDAGGLSIIKDAMQTFSTYERINKNSLKVLKALAGNDDCKAHIIQKGFSPIIINAINQHSGSPNTIAFALGCIAALTLRNAENSKILFDDGAAEAVVEVMKLYPDNEPIQKNASWAIRNMVSRSRYQNEKFLSLGVEAILQENLKKFPKSEYDVKAALRDLGAKVNFKEEWTGKGGRITTQAVK